MIDAGIEHLLVPAHGKSYEQETKETEVERSAAVILATLKALAQAAASSKTSEAVGTGPIQMLKNVLEQRVPSFRCMEDTYFRYKTCKWHRASAAFPRFLTDSSSHVTAQSDSQNAVRRRTSRLAAGLATTTDSPPPSPSAYQRRKHPTP